MSSKIRRGALTVEDKRLVKTQVDQGLLEVIGDSGLRRTGGRVSDDFLNEVRGIRGVRLYREMADNDPVIGCLLWAIESLIAQVSWSVTGHNSDTPRSRQAKDLLDQVLLDMSHSWDDLMSEILTMLTYGWAYFERVYKLRMGDTDSPTTRSRYADNYIGLRKVAIRAQETLSRWGFDRDGGIRGMYQRTDTGEVFIPIEKSLLFRTRTIKNNPEGRSMLRNAVKPYHYLSKHQEIEGIGSYRNLAGMVVLQVPPEIMEPDPSPSAATIRTELEKLVQEIHVDERMGVLIPASQDAQGNPTGYDLSTLQVGARPIDEDKIIRRYESRIAMTFLGEFIFLGTDHSTSFAAHSDKTDLFIMGLGTILSRIRSVLNRYLIPDLMRVNGFVANEWPTLDHGDFEKPDLQGFATFLNTMIGAGVVLPGPKLEQHVRGLGSIPEEDVPTFADSSDDIPPTDNTGPAPTDAPLANTALNGAQVTALQGILESAALGNLPRDSAVEMLVVSFNLTRDQAERVVGSIGRGFKVEVQSEVQS